MEPGVSRRLRIVPISVACDKYWIFCAVLYILYVSRYCCAHRMNDIVHSLSISSLLTLCSVLHWAGLQAPGGTLAAAIYITLRRYYTTPLHSRLTELYFV